MENINFDPKQIRPLYDRVLVKKDNAILKTPGGIIIPDSTVDKDVSNYTGIVVRTSPLRNKDGTLSASALTEGDKVTFSKYSGEYFIDDVSNTTYILLKEIEIFAIIED